MDFTPKNLAPNQNDAMLESEHITALREKIRRSEEAIAALEREQAALLARRKGACDGVMIIIDDVPGAHRSAPGSLRSLLLLTQRDLERKTPWTGSGGENAQ